MKVLSACFPFYNQTILVTQYTIETGDTLAGLLLSEVAYGYGVVPILYQHPGEPDALMPSDDIRLHEGDRLLVLATIRGLRRIEQGKRVRQQWQVAIDRALLGMLSLKGHRKLPVCLAVTSVRPAALCKSYPVSFPTGFIATKPYGWLDSCCASRCRPVWFPSTMRRRSFNPVDCRVDNC